MTQQDTAAFRRVGRGGAGNYLSSSLSDKASKQQQQQDVAAAPLASAAPEPTSRGPMHSLSGRGGAGNYHVEPSQLPGDPEPQRQGTATGEVSPTAASVVGAARLNAPAKSARAAPAGRGGAGNYWNADEVMSHREGVEDGGHTISKGKELEKKVEEAVDQGLKMPDKVYNAKEKVAGKEEL